MQLILARDSPTSLKSLLMRGYKRGIASIFFLAVIVSSFTSVVGFVGAEEELLCRLPLCESHTEVYPSLSRGKCMQAEGMLEVGAGKQHRKRDGEKGN